MRIPDENLDDFTTNITTAKPAAPPPVRSLHFSGKVEVLKPVVSPEVLAEPEAATGSTFLSPSPDTHRLSVSYRSLAFAGGLAIIALILASGIFFAIYRPPVEPAVSQSDPGPEQQPEGILTPREEPDLTDRLIATSLPPISNTPRAVRSVIRRVPARPRVRRAVYRPRNVVRPPQTTETGFVPTTLVIYLEKGEVKTRIEPQLTSGYKKPLALPN